jgi:type IV secretory pathway component VirB8
MTTVPSASSLLDIYGRHAILKIIIKILFLTNKEIVLVIFMYVICNKKVLQKWQKIRKLKISIVFYMPDIS